MYYEIMIAREEFRVRNARLNATHEVEGVTVVVPGIVDRALQALRTALTTGLIAVLWPHPAQMSGRAVAK